MSSTVVEHLNMHLLVQRRAPTDGSTTCGNKCDLVSTDSNLPQRSGAAQRGLRSRPYNANATPVSSGRPRNDNPHIAPRQRSPQTRLVVVFIASAPQRQLVVSACNALVLATRNSPTISVTRSSGHFAPGQLCHKWLAQREQSLCNRRTRATRAASPDCCGTPLCPSPQHANPASSCGLVEEELESEARGATHVHCHDQKRIWG